MEAIFVGMKLYREKVLRGSSPEIMEYTVSKVGRKFFEVEESKFHKFSISNLFYTCKDYSQNNIQLYRSIEEINLKNEMGRLYRKVKEYFSPYSSNNINLNDLRRIAEILNIQ